MKVTLFAAVLATAAPVAAAAMPVVDYSTLPTSSSIDLVDVAGMQFRNPTEFAVGVVRLLMGACVAATASLSLVEFDNGIGDETAEVVLGTLTGISTKGRSDLTDFEEDAVTVDFSALDITLSAGGTYGLALSDSRASATDIYTSAEFANDYADLALLFAGSSNLQNYGCFNVYESAFAISTAETAPVPLPATPARNGRSPSGLA